MNPWLPYVIAITLLVAGLALAFLLTDRELTFTDEIPTGKDS